MSSAQDTQSMRETPAQRGRPRVNKYYDNTEPGIGDGLNQVCAQVESAMLHAC
jgi:hypothetical protein